MPIDEVKLRTTNYRELVRIVKHVARKNRALEIPVLVRRWLDINRDSVTTDDATALLEALETSGDIEWLGRSMETIPILGWVISAVHFLVDGTHAWLIAAQRHDDKAALVGPTVPAPATTGDMARLRKIIAYAGGDPLRELCRTGAITAEEREAFLAADKPDIAEYGKILYFWKGA